MVLRSENILTVLSDATSAVQFLKIAAQQLQEYGLWYKTSIKMNTYNCHISNSTPASYIQKSGFVTHSGLKKSATAYLRFDLWQGNLIKFANK